MRLSINLILQFREEDPLDVDIAIDPEMLGRVLENLLDENIKKVRVFFILTEKLLTLCDYSLKKFLQNKVSKLFLIVKLIL